MFLKIRRLQYLGSYSDLLYVVYFRLGRYDHLLTFETGALKYRLFLTNELVIINLLLYSCSEPSCSCVSEYRFIFSTNLLFRSLILEIV